ncbi:type IV secretory system conjugative DNA transfer family protein, partial [Arsenophonus nasoniae]
MEKCKLTHGQWGFIGLLVCLLTVGIASVLVYPMNGVGLRRFLHTYQFSMLGRILFDSNIRDDIRWNAVLSLLYGFLASVVIAGALIIKTAMQKPSLYGDAKFASDADIRRSKAVTWGDESKGGVIIGRYKGKLLRYIAPDFISMGAGTRAGKGAAIVIPNLLAWLFS